MVDMLYFMIGLGIVFGFAILLSYISKADIIKGLLGYSLLIAPFVYKAGFLELWFIIALIFLNVVIIFSEIRKGGFRL